MRPSDGIARTPGSEGPQGGYGSVVPGDWRAGRLIGVADALDGYLEDLESRRSEWSPTPRFEDRGATGDTAEAAEAGPSADTRPEDRVGTGIAALDAVLGGGLARGRLTLLADASRLGSLAHAIAHRVALGAVAPALLAAPSIRLATTILVGAEAGIDGYLLRSGRLSEADWTALCDALGRLRRHPLHIAQVRARSSLRSLLADHPAPVLVVPAFHRLEEHNGGCVQTLVDVAAETGAAVLASSWLERLPATVGPPAVRVVLEATPAPDGVSVVGLEGCDGTSVGHLTVDLSSWSVH